MLLEILLHAGSETEAARHAHARGPLICLGHADEICGDGEGGLPPGRRMASPVSEEG